MNRAFIRPPKSHLDAFLKPTQPMKKVFTGYGNRFTAFCCSIFGHHYAVTKRVTQHIKEYQCIHCQKQVTTDVNGNLSRLTPELQDINETLQELYRKRHGAAQQQVA